MRIAKISSKAIPALLFLRESYILMSMLTNNKNPPNRNIIKSPQFYHRVLSIWPEFF